MKKDLKEKDVDSLIKAHVLLITQYVSCFEKVDNGHGGDRGWFVKPECLDKKSELDAVIRKDRRKLVRVLKKGEFVHKLDNFRFETDKAQRVFDRVKTDCENRDFKEKKPFDKDKASECVVIKVDSELHNKLIAFKKKFLVSQKNPFIKDALLALLRIDSKLTPKQFASEVQKKFYKGQSFEKSIKVNMTIDERNFVYDFQDKFFNHGIKMKNGYKLINFSDYVRFFFLKLVEGV